MSTRYRRFFRNYWLVNSRVLGSGVPLRELLTLKYPHRLPDAPKPPALTVEFTDHCDLRCAYCNNLLFNKPRTYMGEDVFQRLLQQIEAAKINRVRVSGGEPTLHPEMGRYMKELASRVKFLSIITNGQWKKPNIIKELVASGVDLVEVSVDAGGAEYYEKSRQGASYQRLLDNLAALKEERDRQGAKLIIKSRLMVRPSTKDLEDREVAFLRRYVDSVLPQYILKHPDSEYEEDVFYPRHVVQGEYTRCSMIFKDMQILMDGSVPLCQVLGSIIDDDRKLFVGNILHDDILDIWRGEQMTRVRNAHRNRVIDDMAMCKGCNAM